MKDSLENYLRVLFPFELETDEFIAVQMVGDNTFVKFIKTTDELRHIIKRYRAWNNIYVSLTTNRGTNSRTSKSLYRRGVIAVDFDRKDFSAEYSLKDYINMFKKSDLYYHMIVDTGHGYHFYVGIDTTEEIGKVTDITKRLSSVIGSDTRVANTTQVMRVPTSLNVKNIENIKPVIVVHNIIENEYCNFIRYELNSFSKLNAFNVTDISKKFSEKVSAEHRLQAKKEFKCIVNMLERGAEKGERNFCMGRIINYYRDVIGYNEVDTFKMVTHFNKLCVPAKGERELISDFEGYWDSGVIKLLGCKIKDERKFNILSKYCDKCADGFMSENIIIKNGIGIYLPAVFVRDDMLAKLKGWHYLILLLIANNENKVSVEYLYQAVKGDTKHLISKRRMIKYLAFLKEEKLISEDSWGNYVILEKDKGLLINKNIISSVINNSLTVTELLVYICLKVRCDRHINATQEKIGSILNIEQGHISRHIKKLEESKFISVKKYRNTSDNFYHNIYEFI